MFGRSIQAVLAVFEAALVLLEAVPVVPRAVPVVPKAALIVSAVLLSGCGGGDAASGPTAMPRSDDVRLLEARAALEEGRLGSAQALIDQLGEDAGVEPLLLRARLNTLSDNSVEALRAIESARELAPGDPRPFATAAEIYCLLGRLDAAREEVQRGVEMAGGRGPELTRALGVLALSTPGQAPLGVELIEDALARDPALPFCTLPLARGKELLARAAIGNNELERAEQLLEECLTLSSDDPAARETLAELRMVQRRLEDSVAIYESLLAEGHPVAEPLRDALRSAATGAMLNKDRDLQVDHLLRMRELGVRTEDLGFGARVLEQAAAERTEAATELFREAESIPIDASADSFEAAVASRERQFERAAELYRQALDLNSDSGAARRGLGAALFRMGRYEEAALEWENLATRLAGNDTPFPLHLDLARAWLSAADPERARGVLTEYLERYPSGRWIDATEELLEAL